MSNGERIPLVTAQPVSAQPVDFVTAYPILVGIEGNICFSHHYLFSIPYAFSLVHHRPMPKGYPEGME